MRGRWGRQSPRFGGGGRGVGGVGTVQAEGLDGGSAGRDGNLVAELAGLVSVPVGQAGRGLADEADQRILGSEKACACNCGGSELPILRVEGPAFFAGPALTFWIP